tara:strand:- start:241 stop:1167 length:927 start_codon:yes stop_codon:yes gene_type:complete
MSNSTNNIISWVIRILISVLFLVSAYAKVYHEPSAYFSITTFEQKQLVPLGFDSSLAAFFSRTLIALEFTLGILIMLPFQLKRVVIPITIGILAFFSIHLGIQIYLTGNAGNCGCFGALIEMTPLEAIIKNVLAIGLLVILYFLQKSNQFVKNDLWFFSPVFYLFLALLFIYIPIKESPEKKISEFSDVVPSVDDGKVLLCFFAAGCDHCRSTMRSLDSLNSIYVNDFPRIEIVFMEEETEKIPEFFEYAGNNYAYQILDIPTFYEVLTWERDTPGVFYMWNGNIITSYNGINEYAFKVDSLVKALGK